MPETSLPLRPLLVVPALISLAVTLLRLGGELLQWSPTFFSREAGGGGAVVGISWLIPLFGIYFALRLARMGEGPPGAARVFGWALVGFVANTAVFFLAFALFPKSPQGQLALFGVGSLFAVAVARPGWPALWRVLVAYGLAARLPVVVIMLLAIFLGWDSHYAKPRPDFPPTGPLGLFLWTGLLPQMTIWIFLTVVGGMIFGALALAVRRLFGGARAGLAGQPGSASAG
ncbi:MAG TPA: hypothetical protein VMR21_16880 [Vicinamibacteria bacterium]|nr:hypothetical protein [Vicinamibacteria bacterium]